MATSPPFLMTVAVILVSLTVAVGFLLQARRLRDHGVGGFSGGSWLLLLFVVPTWLGYGLRHDDLGVIVANSVLLLPTLAVVSTWGRRTGRVIARPTLLLALVGATVAFALLAPLGVVGAAALVVDAGTAWPQAVRAIRSPTVVGVSISAWAFRASTLAIWTWYGILAALPFLALASLNKLIASLAIATAAAVKRRRAEATGPVLGVA